MKNYAPLLATAFSLAFVSTAPAALTGDTFDFSTAKTGSVTIVPLGPAGNFTVPAGPAFCVGPNSNNCVSSGLSGSISFNASQIVFTFSGSTTGTAGTFVLNLTNFLPANILNVTYNSGSLINGTFGLTLFSSSSMVFTGSQTDGIFNAVGGRTIVFDVVTASPATIAKSFTPSKIVPGGTSALSLTLTNPNASVTVNGVNFVDTYPAGVTTATPSALTSTCGGTAVAGTGSVSLTSGTIAAGGTCAITVNVTSNEGIKNNAVTVSSNFGAGNTATATLTAATPPVLSKSFGEVSIGQQNKVDLVFILKNPNTALALSGLAFTDTLPAGLVVGTPNGLAGSCGGGTITAVAGSNSVTLTGATLAAGASCTFGLAAKADGAAFGTLTNTTSTVASNEAIPGAAATAKIFVGDPVQMSYAANLGIGDSFTDITNVGTSGAALPSGTTATISGALCANVYTFSADEQLVSCCSCPVTPGGLVALSAQQDLISNTLTPAVPTSIVIKVVASVPVAGSCTNSAASVTAANLANGLKSFETTIHATPAAGPYSVTETRFLPTRLSTGDLSRITQLCNFILANGSGFGVCRSCRLGGLGTDRQ